MSSSEQDTTSSEDNLSYDSGTRSRSPHIKEDKMDKMSETIDALIKQLAAKDAEIQRLTNQIVEERARNEARHQEMLSLIASMGRGAVTQPSEATEPVAETTPQLAEEMEVEAGPSGIKRGAPEEAGSPTEEGRPPKGKRPATAQEKRSFAQAAAEIVKKTTRVTEAPANTEEEKQPKIPPIILHKRDIWSTVAKQLQDKRINYTKARLTSHGIEVRPSTISDYRQMTKCFDDRKLEYHTYSLPEERQLRVIIRGLPEGLEMDEIKDDLASQGFTVNAAERLTCRRTKRSMPLVLVKLPQDQEKVLEVNRCCSLVVRVERQKAQQQSTQCFRCQRFGHAQSKCTGEARCVKCGQNHRSNECGKAREQPAQCANCKGAHPANYRGCPSCPKQRGALKGKTSPRQEPATRVPVAPAASGKKIPPPKVPSGGASTSFAEVTRRGKRVTPQATPETSPGKKAVTMGDAEVALAKMTKMFAAMSQILQQFGNFGV